MIKVLLNGCNGKMGQSISDLAKSLEDINISAGVSPSGAAKENFPVYKSIFECSEAFDVIIDFSKAESLDNLLYFAMRKHKPVLIATTGHTQQQILKIHKASKQIPIFHCANTSLGINLLLDIVRKATSVLGENFDIEIVEKHHNQKVDAPSGTAVIIANAINEVSPLKYNYIYDRHSLKNKRTRKEIGIHSIRGGTYVGEHTVIFAGNDEVIEIKHSALSKKIFAEGAVQIAKFLVDKPKGLYSMDDMIKG